MGTVTRREIAEHTGISKDDIIFALSKTPTALRDGRQHYDAATARADLSRYITRKRDMTARKVAAYDSQLEKLKTLGE